MRLSADVTGVTNPISINVSSSHGSATANATVICKTHTLGIGDDIIVQLGYDSSNTKVFKGYVKRIEQKTPDGLYTIVSQDKMVRAVEFFIVSGDPKAPLTYSNISGENLVKAVLALANLTSYTSDTTHFNFGTLNPIEVNLVAAYDFAKQVTDILAYDLWCDDNGQVHFEDRRPYVMGGDSSILTLDDTSIHNILSASYVISDRDLRNKIVVYGSEGIYAEAHASSAYLPAGFYKTVVVASQWIDYQDVAQAAADYNLSKLNRLTKELSLEVIGNPILVARKVVNVTESITGATGNWYIYACEHRWASAGYICSMELRS